MSDAIRASLRVPPVNYPGIRPGAEDGVAPLTRHLLLPAAALLKGFARRPLGMELFLEAEPPGQERWRILVLGCPDFGLVEGPICTACVLRDHPVLWRHRPYEMELTLNGSVRDPEEAVAALVRSHLEVVREASHGLGARWIAPEHFAGDLRSLVPRLRDGGGIVARGPQVLMEAWAAVLDHAGGSTGLLSRRGRWDRPKKGDRTLRALFLGGSFVLGTSVECRRA